MAEELNVKHVEFPARADQYISYTILPDLKRLGPRLGKQLPEVKKTLAAADAAALFTELEKQGQIVLQLAGGAVTLDSEEVQIRLQAKPGWAAAQGPIGVVVLSTELTPDLLAEGTARELTHAIAGVRRDIDCRYTDRIEVGVVTDDVEVIAAVEQFADYIKAETLADSVTLGPLECVDPQTVKIGPASVQLCVKVVSDERCRPDRNPDVSLRAAQSAAAGGADFGRRHDAAQPDRKDRRRPARRPHRAGNLQQARGRRFAICRRRQHPHRHRRAAAPSPASRRSARRCSTSAARPRLIWW